MTVTIKAYETYREEEVLSLYTSVGWTNYTNNPAMLSDAFKQSLKVYAAFEKEQLLGLIRVVGDGHSIVFVQDLLIHPAFQRQGLGRRLMQRILSEYSQVYQIHLLTDDSYKTRLFYEALGFEWVDDLGTRAFTLVKR